ncbi:hypothetical protein GALMADRAFT_139748 [Galerina marginata CBS 339.88]|uniref:FAD/NAD(P)-binding domain-containing protein n=1 Tax=Galerina marginata (strain CBS 339.88) TaxID=685588 RepID=A0A067SYQ5_GALM3|nr:hypothetical protein GALMADRAFT_139748 [Galerina marginata CBS 339.88]
MSSPSSLGPSIVIIGAGFGGIAAAIKLKRQGVKSFTIFEKASEVGGTWRDNTYPGCTSDISVHFYSLSTDLNPDWDRTCAYQPSILAYLKTVVDKHGLAPHVIFNTKVISAEWNSATQAYTVTTEDVASGSRSTRVANIVISAQGALSVPKHPNILGLKDFRGQIMHTATWDKAVDLRGKRVAVIGNGSSAAQTVSRIAYLDGIQLTQFVRTPNWMLPAMSVNITRPFHWAFRHIPFSTRSFRWVLFWVSEFYYLSIFKLHFMRKPLSMLAKTFIQTYAPKEYLPLLLPQFPVGCRRIVFEDRYLPALHLPNVSLRSGTEIASIVTDGIIMQDDKKVAFDVIICATGFSAGGLQFLVRGVDSTLQEFYDKNGGPSAYLGSTVPGFPNLYQLFGPNTATGYTSVVFTLETQVDYMMQLIKPVLERKFLSFDVTPEANNRYNTKLQGMFKDSVFTFCGSWYRAGGSGKNVMVFPSTMILFWWWCRSVVWSDYQVIGPNGRQMKDVSTLGANSKLVAAAYTAVSCAVVALAYLASQH